ncbi:MAG: outer membrane protein assembly factor BamA [Nitrospirae bacterium]|nr:outer membrane protein assembly factor BamA [Nitrospirota bacterium]
MTADEKTRLRARMSTDKTQIKLNIATAFFLLLTVYCLLPTATIYASDSEKVIKAIEVQGVRRIRPEELIEMICLAVGDPLDKDVLHTGIKRAFKKGVFLDIKAVTEPLQDGVKLKYIVNEIPVINRILIEGNKFITKKRIKDFLAKAPKHSLAEGGDFILTGQDVRDAELALLNFYDKKGVPKVKLKIEAKKDKTPYKINIRIMIEEGKPIIIKTVSAPPEIKGIMKVSEGSIFDRELVDKDIAEIKQYYREQGYINPIVGPYEFKDGELSIPVAKGLKLEIDFKGNTIFSSKSLIKKMPFMEDEEVTDKLMDDAANLIKQIYWQEGYNQVQVAGGMETKGDAVKVTFFIFEDKKVILREIIFEGITIPAQTIEGIIPLKKQKPFDETILDSSIESIISFYNGLGYLDADIKEVKKEFKNDYKELKLIFAVNEGGQTKIEKINISGNKDISLNDINKVLILNEPAPYNAVDIEDARYRILSLYSRLGYADARVEIEKIIENGRAFVTFKITEGRRFSIRKIVIRGNKKTKDTIIRREFDIKEGEPYNYEKLLSAKQRLYKLGLFTEVSIEPIETTTPQPKRQEINKDNLKDLLVSLKEGNAGAVEVGIGYGDYESLRGFFDISYRNMGGYNKQIGLRTELSSIEKRHVLSFKEPRFLNKPQLPLKIFLTQENKRAINLDTKDVMYKIDKTSLLLGVDKELTERLKTNLNYEYSIVDTKDVKQGVILSKEDTGTLGISSISSSLFYDTRDNPFDPTAGSLKGIVLKLASGALLSETEFIKTTVHGAWFFKVQKGLVFAFSLRGGGAYGLGETSELPLIERFFLGGRTTVRGYSQDTLGPKGAEDTPTGGNAFAIANVELRIYLVKGLGLVTFVDSGNVWKDTNDIDTDLKYTAGGGIRYNTPVGPFRLDYGHKLNKEGGESRGELHFSLGHAF